MHGVYKWTDGKYSILVLVYFHTVLNGLYKSSD